MGGGGGEEGGGVNNRQVSVEKGRLQRTEMSCSNEGRIVGDGAGSGRSQISVKRTSVNATGRLGAAHH